MTVLTTVDIPISDQMKPHASAVETNFQYRFSVNEWCRVIGEQLIESFMLKHCFTGQMYLQFLENELPQLLKDVPLKTGKGMCFQHDRSSFS